MQASRELHPIRPGPGLLACDFLSCQGPEPAGADATCADATCAEGRMC